MISKEYFSQEILINQTNTDKQNLEKKIGDIDKKYQTLMDSRLLLFLILKLVKLRSRDIKGTYFTTADYNKFTSAILDAKLRQKI